MSCAKQIVMYLKNVSVTNFGLAWKARYNRKREVSEGRKKKIWRMCLLTQSEKKGNHSVVVVLREHGKNVKISWKSDFFFFILNRKNVLRKIVILRFIIVFNNHGDKIYPLKIAFHLNHSQKKTLEKITFALEKKRRRF